MTPRSRLARPLRRHGSGWTLILGASLLLAPASVAARPLRIVDADGRPVPGARVEAFAPVRGTGLLNRLMPPLSELETDAAGIASLALPGVDGLLLVVDHPDFTPWIGAPPADTATLTLSTGAVWRGRARPKGGEVGAGRACASWEEELPAGRPARGFQRCAPLARDGSFLLGGVPRRKVEVEVEARGFLPARASLEAGAALDLALERGVLLAGTVVGPGAVPIPLALVSAPGAGAAESDREGRFELAVRALPVVLGTTAAGFRPGAMPVADKPPSSRRLMVRLTPTEGFVATLLGTSGAPIEETDVRLDRLLANGGTERLHRRLPSPGGELRVELPGPGRYRARIAAAGYRATVLPEIAVGPSETAALGVVALGRGAVVSGTLVDPRDRPVMGAEVELLPQGMQLVEALLDRRLPRAVSGEDGSFELAGLEPGRYELRLRHGGFATTTQAIVLAADGREDLGSLQLERGARVRGRLLDRAGRPRPGLLVRLFDPELASLLAAAEATTGVDGSFALPAVAPGRYRFEVTGGRRLLDEEIEAPRDEEEVVVERAVGGVLLRGVVTRGGEPVVGGRLMLVDALDPSHVRGKLLLRTDGSLRPEGWGLPESVITAEVGGDGAFTAFDAPAGALWATYVNAAGEARTQRVAVPDAAEASVAIEVGGVGLQGRVAAAETGDGIEALVRVVDPSGRVLAETTSGADGSFAIADLPSGRHGVQARAEGWTTTTLAGVEVAEGSPPLAIALERGERSGLAVALRREDGSPAAGVSLVLLDGSGTMLRALPTDGFGERRFEGLAAGTYFLVWADPLAGTGASRPIRLDGRRPTAFATVLGQGGTVELACGSEPCRNARVDGVSVFSPDGVELGAHLSGVSTAMHLSATGRLALGRLTPGSYLLWLWVGGTRYELPLDVGPGGAVVPLAVPTT